MANKNTICLWYDGTAMDAARFYAETFPDSAVGAVMRAPGDYPDGKQGDVLTVEFTVVGIPCVGLNGGPAFQAQRGVLVPDRDRRPGRNRPLVERDRRQRRPGKRMRLVQGQVGPVVADHAARPHRRDLRSRSRGGQACVRSDDDDEKDRHRRDRGGAAGLSFTLYTAKAGPGNSSLARFVDDRRFVAVRARDAGAGRPLVSAAAACVGLAYSLGHGGNDAQKTMGIIWVLLIGTGHLAERPPAVVGRHAATS